MRDWRVEDLEAKNAELVARCVAAEEALRRIEALRTNEHAAGFDEAREIAATALAAVPEENQ